METALGVIFLNTFCMYCDFGGGYFESLVIITELCNSVVFLLL